jgi:hypothetical protein
MIEWLVFAGITVAFWIALFLLYLFMKRRIG